MVDGRIIRPSPATRPRPSRQYAENRHAALSARGEGEQAAAQFSLDGVTVEEGDDGATPELELQLYFRRS